METVHRKNKVKNAFSKAMHKEVLVEVSDPTVMQVLYGEADANLALICKELDLTISRIEQGLVVAGMDSEVDLAVDVLTQLRDIVKSGEGIFTGDIQRAIRMLSENQNAKLADLYREQVRVNGKRKSIVPKTVNQKKYTESILAYDCVFGVGPAGTGKTYLAMAMAVAELSKKTIKRIVLCRPAVEAGEKLGFLPGDMAEKVNPYLRPLYDALHDMVEAERAQEMIEKGVIEVAPLAFMRGRTLSNSFVILDEAQNTTTEQMKMFLTRLGPGSKCVVTGDVTQIDLPRGIKSGLIDAVNKLQHVNGISIIHFGVEDVIRHPLVAKIVAAYEAKKDE
ncbi:MAG: PhoH family protein [bacterium]|nr:PhoH family protein [bacterium]